MNEFMNVMPRAGKCNDILEHSVQLSKVIGFYYLFRNRT